jgi:hypothetical protein
MACVTGGVAQTSCEVGGNVMFCASRVVPIVAVIWLAGCAIHPLPDDVTGVTTANIVKQVRCEARQAIFDFATDWLVNEQKDPDPEAREIGRQFKEGLRPINSFSYTLFRGQVRQLVQLFSPTGIAYNFQLQMQETDNIDPMTDLLTFSGKNQFASPVSGNADRMRQNTRTFTVTDTFDFLLRNIPDDYCSGHIIGPNYIYPVAGKIGVDRMIGDFVNLTLFENLAAPATSAGNPFPANAKGPPTMVDQLQFTTTVSLSATPKVTFAPIKTFVDASVALKFARTDTHTVTIGLAVSDKTSLSETATIRSAVFAPGPLGSLISGRPASNAEFLAMLAVNQVLTQQLFKPTININTN